MGAKANTISVKRKMMASLVSFPKTVVQNVVSPIVSLKNVKVTKESTGQVLLFLVKVAALEVVRRGSMARCPQVWWSIQGIALLQAPPLSWLLRWTPLRYLIQGTQVFSKPLLFLSVATSITGFSNEQRVAKEDQNDNDQGIIGEQRSTEENSIVAPLVLLPTPVERVLADLHETEKQTQSLGLLKQELEKARIALPERITDDDLEGFLAAANGSLHKSVSLVKKSARWRERFYFFTPQELEIWSELVFWHGRDIRLRPSLVIRLGRAYTLLKTDERPRFVQAIVSQVEYGVINLLHEEDPRITVIMDCEGTHVLGFPVHMMKSCCVLLQENYPTRLAAFFVINLPQVVRVIAKAVIQENSEADQLHNHGQLLSKLLWIQVLRPTTRGKIHLESDQYARALLDHHGGAAYVPKFFGGSCMCSHCRRAAAAHHEGHMFVTDGEPVGNEIVEDNPEEGSSDEQQHLTSFQTYNSVLRAIILGILMLWLIVALIASFYDLEESPLPT